MINNEIKMATLSDEEMATVNGGRIRSLRSMSAETAKEKKAERSIIRRKKARA